MNERRTGKDWPEDELPPDEEELGAAREFGEHLDRALQGEQLPDAAGLLAAARMARLAFGPEERLAEARRNAIIEEGMRRALTRRARRPQRWLAPAFAVAASLLLVTSLSLFVSLPQRSARAPISAVSPRTLSRPSDELMGKPFTDRAGASSRLDLVYADRLNGYRQVMLGRGESQ
jgi:hypothetical protein